MTFQKNLQVALFALLLSVQTQTVQCFNQFIPIPSTQKTPVNLQSPVGACIDTSTNKHTSLKASSFDIDFTLPPGLEVQESYEQGEVPLFAVVNATMRTSKLIYHISSMKLDIREDIRENRGEWVDGEDMLKDGVLLEEDIAAFVTKNKAKIDGNANYGEMLDYEKGIKGDNRLRCLDAEYAADELVYGINVNRSRKQVTVAFRGTNTQKDMLVDLDIRKYVCKDGDDTYEIHNGFRNYLNRETEVDGDGDLTKLEQITQNLEEIMESDCEGYDVYVTGHSLGGALATLYGLRLAQTKKFPVVNVVSYASPFVGTEGFRKIFRQAELDGIVRHIRVSNTNDCIPANPCIGGFSHVGVNLELRKSGPVMNYEGVEKPSLPVAFVGFLASFVSILVKFFSIFIGFLQYVPTIPILPSALLAYATVTILLDNHLFPEHRNRFKTGLENAPFLAKTIEEVYENRLQSIAKNGV